MVTEKKTSTMSIVSVIMAIISIIISLCILSEQFEYRKILKNHIKKPFLSCPVIIKISSTCNFDSTKIIDKNKLKVYVYCEEELHRYDFSDPQIEEIKPIIVQENKSLSPVLVDVDYDKCSLKK